MSLTSRIFLTPRQTSIDSSPAPPDNPIDNNDWEWHDGEGGTVAHVWNDGTDAEWWDSPIPSIGVEFLWQWQNGEAGEWQNGQFMQWQEGS